MDIRLGMPVSTVDGTRIGRVERIALDPDEGELLELIVHQGHLLTRDRIVDRAFVSDVDVDGTVYLTLTAAEVEALPLVAPEHIISTTPDRGSTAMPLGGPTMEMPILWRGGTDGRGQRHASSRHYRAAVADAAGVETRSNLPGNAITVSRTTEVVDAAGRKLGNLAIVLYGCDGEIRELIVRSGHRRRHELRVPRAWIDQVTHGSIRLNVDGPVVETENTRWAANDWSARAAAHYP